MAGAAAVGDKTCCQQVDLTLSYSNQNELRSRIKPLAKHLHDAGPAPDEHANARRRLSRRPLRG
jgi:hypothetical protein